jgi:hypothetical protein
MIDLLQEHGAAAMRRAKRNALLCLSAAGSVPVEVLGASVSGRACAPLGMLQPRQG